MAALPDSPFAWGCLLLGVAFLVPALRGTVTRWLTHASQRAYAVTLLCTALLLNLAYVHFYLRGGPRIIDATAYWLQAHVFASGSYTFAAPGPLHAFGGRFLVVTPSGELSVLFPPGFAAVLAFGVRLGVPMLVNPVLGALCALLTYALGRAWWDERIGRLAGVLSALCAALRYHSADTMSHVWCACLVLTLLLAVTAPGSPPKRGWTMPLVAGLCAGWLFATRPLTGLVFGGLGLVAGLVVRPRQGAHLWRTVGAYALGCAPGLCLWFTYQWVTTGSMFISTQSVYYARSDWPSDCFGLGFGANVGCRFEHGDFLARYQPHGYGLREALAVCGRRLWSHLRDVANLPWLPLVSVVTLGGFTRSRPVAVTWTLWVAHIAAYALFYYDGNYPGGGARLYAELLPLQHLLLAVALASFGAEWMAVPLAAIGFSVWSATQHRALSEREGGRPMYEPAVLEARGITNALVFVNTDHGFDLGFVPRTSAASSPIVARGRGDAFDYTTWVNLGKPEAYRYTFDPYRADSLPALTRFTPEPNSTFLGSSLWPPVTSDFGSVSPEFAHACGTPGISLHPTTSLSQQTRVELWVSTPGEYRLELRSERPIAISDWPWAVDDSGTVTEGCLSRVTEGRRLALGPLPLTLVAEQSATLASIELTPVRDPHGPGATGAP